MSDTAVPAIVDIASDLGGSGQPKTVVDALALLRSEVDEMPSDPITTAEIDAIMEGGSNA